MRTVGNRVQGDISFDASAEKLLSGSRWNDAMQKVFGACQPGIFPKGVFQYRSHEEADEALLDALAKRMATIALTRRHG
jgi:hypothetical protein